MDPNIQQPVQPEVHVAQPTQEISSKPKKSKFILTVIAIIVLVIVGAGSYYMGIRKETTQQPIAANPTTTPTATSSLTPTQTVTTVPIIDPTANWETYVNKTYAFSVKYPKGWYQLEETSIIPLAVFFNDKKIELIKQSEGPLTPVTIAVRRGNLAGVIKDIEGANTDPVKNVSVNGVAAKAFEGQSFYIADTYYKRIYFEKNNFVYSIGYLSSPALSLKDFNNSVDTFKFAN